MEAVVAIGLKRSFRLRLFGCAHSLLALCCGVENHHERCSLSWMRAVKTRVMGSSASRSVLRGVGRRLSVVGDGRNGPCPVLGVVSCIRVRRADGVLYAKGRTGFRVTKQFGVHCVERRSRVLFCSVLFCVGLDMMR